MRAVVALAAVVATATAAVINIREDIPSPAPASAYFPTPPDATGKSQPYVFPQIAT